MNRVGKNAQATKKTLVGGDQNQISGGVTAGGVSIQGRNASVTIHQTGGEQMSEINALFNKLFRQIEMRAPDPNVDKEEIVDTVQKIQNEVSKNESISETKLTRWMDYLNKIAPDIIDVVLASLAGPVSGATAVLKKIADRSRQKATN